MTNNSSDSQLPPPPESKQSMALTLSIIAIVLVLLLSAGSGVYFWQQLQTFSSSTIDQKDQFEKLEQQVLQLRQQLAQFNNGQSNFNEGLRQELEQLTDQSKFHSETLIQLKNGSRLDWLLAESEYLLRLANQRLYLEKDLNGSILILSSAQQVLAEISDPALVSVQKSVAKELLALKSVSQSDKQAAYVQIQALISSVKSLPDEISRDNLADNSLDKPSSSMGTPPAEEASDQDSFTATISAIGDALKGAIKIKKVSEDAPPILVPEQRYFLRQNLMLIYEQAALALLNEQEIAYKNSLNKAALWLEQYFETGSPQVNAHLNQIATLSSQSIAAELPDITSSLRLLKTQIEGLYRDHALTKHLSPAEEFSLVNIKGDIEKQEQPKTASTSKDLKTNGDQVIEQEVSE